MAAFRLPRNHERSHVRLPQHSRSQFRRVAQRETRALEGGT